MTKKVWEKEFWRKVDIKWRKGGLQADEGRRRWGKHPADFLDTLSVKQFINSLLSKQDGESYGQGYKEGYADAEYQVKKEIFKDIAKGMEGTYLKELLDMYCDDKLSLQKKEIIEKVEKMKTGDEGSIYGDRNGHLDQAIKTIKKI